MFKEVNGIMNIESVSHVPVSNFPRSMTNMTAEGYSSRPVYTNPQFGIELLTSLDHRDIIEMFDHFLCMSLSNAT